MTYADYRREGERRREMTAERSRTMRPRPSSSRGRVRRAVSHHEDHAHDQDHYQDHDCDQDQDDLDHDDDHG